MTLPQITAHLMLFAGPAVCVDDMTKRWGQDQYGCHSDSVDTMRL